MFAAFAQFFATIIMFFKALEHSASAVNHLATWADESAGAFSDEARIERQKKLNGLNRELTASATTSGKQPKQLAATTE